MKVLVVDEWLPWPLETGKKIRTFNTIANLANRHEIHFLAYVDKNKDNEKIKIFQEIGIHVIPVPDVRTAKWTTKFYWEVIINFFLSVPFSTQYHVTKAFKERMHNAVRRLSPDLIHCEWTNLAPLLEEYGDFPTVIAAHNIESDIWYRFALNGSNIFKRLLGRVQAKRIEKLERKWYPRVDRCIAVSEADKLVIEEYGGKVSLVDNGVDLEFYNENNKIGQREELEGNRIIFVASFDTFSNQDGAHYFVNNIFPILQEALTDIELWLVGKNPPAKIREYGEKNSQIKVTGSVPDVREFIARSKICIVPLRIGGGSRLKILEAMAMHKPIVSTSIGAEGLSITDGKNIVLADLPDDFAAAILDILRDERKQRMIGNEGYALVTACYDWDHLTGLQDEAWQKAQLHFQDGVAYDRYSGGE
ncbi:MAG: glycosyltransferase family 4 protein [Candidatus Electrothrix sp. GW3-4]|uniref:glycosyltransferase family 4 protein n=1 Tax=Candidatus Electrothrix sp. GW3-4 TaxID=3126740 RepID=UPI0030D186AC